MTVGVLCGASGRAIHGLIELAVVQYQKQQVPVTISPGDAAFAEQPDVATKLVAAADAALYDAKQGGRNRAVKARP